MTGRLTSNGATYKALEIYGEVIDALSVEARMTISNLAVETGAKVGLMKCDEKIIEYLRTRAKRAFKGVDADADAKYERCSRRTSASSRRRSPARRTSTTCCRSRRWKGRSSTRCSSAPAPTAGWRT